MTHMERKGDDQPQGRGSSWPEDARDKVAEIIREAQAETVAPGEDEDLAARIRQSENKRLLLAEALHASREQIRQLLHRDETERDRALPFGVFVRPGTAG